MNREETNLQYEYIEKLKEIITNLSASKKRKIKACVTTFGCQMNAKDSEKLCGILDMCGFEITDNEDEADFVIFNTCTVRDNANQTTHKIRNTLFYIINNFFTFVIKVSE